MSMTFCYRQDLTGQLIDSYPLLMDHLSASSNQDHVINIFGSRNEVERGSLQSDLDNASGSLQSNIGMSMESSPLPPVNEAESSLAASLQRETLNEVHSNVTRSSPFNSGLWISIELIITLSQIIASIIVLSLSRHEQPHTPLAIWVVGYAIGCLATFPILYWRYASRYGRLDYQNPSYFPSTSNSNGASASAGSSYTLPILQSSQMEQERGFQSTLRNQITNVSDTIFPDARVASIAERYKVALDCFFAVWFVVGNVWVFGGRTSSHEAPNLYRLCIAFLTFSCIGYAMPFILCATICCCLPCIIALFGLRDDQKKTKGASQEVIDSLPVYKFKAKGGNRKQGSIDMDDSDSDGPEEGGLVAAGTENERVVSAEDASCCICLGKYKDNEELKELPCTHLFHIECVDKWLKINSSCPLCKIVIGGTGENAQQLLLETEES